MPHKSHTLALGLGLALMLAPSFLHADENTGSTSHGPPWGPGTAIKQKPVIGATSPVAAAAATAQGVPVMQFAPSDRDVIGGYFRTYFLCPACGYTGTYTPYQAGAFIGGGYTPFPTQLTTQLPPPPAGMIYVFANRNALLVNQQNGQILDVIPLMQQSVPLGQAQRSIDFSAPPVQAQQQAPE